MPRDKILYAIQGAIAAYVIYASASAVYQNLKAKDRLKRKLFDSYSVNQIKI